MYCECGCGQRTKLASITSKRSGWVKGQPLRFVNGHYVPPHRTNEERFWEKVQKTDGCWLWTGSLHDKGYGQFAVREGESEYRTVKAHRYALELHTGQSLGELQALHRCDNPPCVRPDHLYPGTHHDNMRDRAERGRTVGLAGAAHPAARLSDAQVAEIRQRYAAGGVTLKQLADEYGHSKSGIYGITSGRFR